MIYPKMLFCLFKYLSRITCPSFPIVVDHTSVPFWSSWDFKDNDVSKCILFHTCNWLLQESVSANNNIIVNVHLWFFTVCLSLTHTRRISGIKFRILLLILSYDMHYPHHFWQWIAFILLLDLYRQHHFLFWLFLW